MCLLVRFAPIPSLMVGVQYYSMKSLLKLIVLKVLIRQVGVQYYSMVGVLSTNSID